MQTRRVRMMQTRRGNHNPYTFFKYEAGKTYALPATLAAYYIEKGIAIEDKSIDVVETKKRKVRAK